MSGVTDAPVRRLIARLGAGLVVSEMTASQALVEGRADVVLRTEGPGLGIHVVQLAGCEARWMGEGARIAEAAGAAMIDINMGCPARHVIGGESGSALMRDLDHALTLIEATVAAVSVPVIGWVGPAGARAEGGALLLLYSSSLAAMAPGAGVGPGRPFDLAAGHYFFVPQIQLKNGLFLWLSTASGQFTGDLQEWIRNSALQPDWLRVGTDIVGGATPPTFDTAFSLSGTTTA